MKVKVVKNKDIAFSGFLRNVIDYGRYEWIQKWQKGSLKKIPISLAKKLSNTSNFYFTYEKHPEKDIESTSKRTTFLIKKLEKIHDKEWNMYSKKIEILSKNLNKIVKKYGKLLIKTIPQKTGIHWKYKSVWLVPSIYFGSTTEDNKTFIGVCRPKKDLEELARLPGLVHELIHVNEQEKFLSRMNKENLLKFVIDEYREYKYPNATREIVTMLLTNSIVEELEKTFNFKLNTMRFHPHYRPLMRKIEKELEMLPKSNFITMRRAVDNLIYEKFGELRA